MERQQLGVVWIRSGEKRKMLFYVEFLDTDNLLLAFELSVVYNSYDSFEFRVGVTPLSYTKENFVVLFIICTDQERVSRDRTGMARFRPRSRDSSLENR